MCVRSPALLIFQFPAYIIFPFLLKDPTVRLAKSHYVTTFPVHNMFDCV